MFGDLTFDDDDDDEDFSKLISSFAQKKPVESPVKAATATNITTNNFNSIAFDSDSDEDFSSLVKTYSKAAEHSMADVSNLSSPDKMDKKPKFPAPLSAAEASASHVTEKAPTQVNTESNVGKDSIIQPPQLNSAPPEEVSKPHSEDKAQASVDKMTVSPVKDSTAEEREVEPEIKLPDDTYSNHAIELGTIRSLESVPSHAKLQQEEAVRKEVDIDLPSEIDNARKEEAVRAETIKTDSAYQEYTPDNNTAVKEIEMQELNRSNITIQSQENIKESQQSNSLEEVEVVEVEEKMLEALPSQDEDQEEAFLQAPPSETIDDPAISNNTETAVAAEMQVEQVPPQEEPVIQEQPRESPTKQPEYRPTDVVTTTAPQVVPEQTQQEQQQKAEEVRPALDIPQRPVIQLPEELTPIKKSPIKAESVRSSSPTKQMMDYENLGDNYMSTEWVPPSIERMKEYQEDRVYRSGTAELSSVRVIDAPDLGVGVCLYFQFLKGLAVYFLIASILSIPSILIAYNGSRIATTDQDAMGLYKFTLGNMGYDPLSPTYATDSACKSARYSLGSGTCLHLSLVGQSVELSMRDAAYIITGFEMLQVLLFLLFIRVLYNKAVTIEAKLAGTVVKLSDYTVQVTNLPPSYTSSELIQHFSDLYQLQAMDWRKRPPIRCCTPAENIFHNVPNSWVAQCTTFKRIGKMIYSFKQKADLIDSIKQTRAYIKMYSEGTQHKKGSQPKKCNKLKGKLEKDQKKMMALTKAVAGKMSKSGAVRPELLVDSTSFSPSKQNQHSPKHSPNQRDRFLEEGRVAELTSNYNNTTEEHVNVDDPLAVINTSPVCAFLTFEYCESFARCIEDYERYSSFPFFLCYPQTMKFKGQKLKIKKAPEPDEIVWENIEIGYFKRMFFRVSTGIVSSILLFLVFVALLQTTIIKNRLKNKIPVFSDCNAKIPLMFSNSSHSEVIKTLKLVRPPEPSEYDEQCDALSSKAFYAIYAHDGDFDRPAAHYNITACEDVGYCPVVAQEVFCPCVSATISDQCDSDKCSELRRVLGELDSYDEIVFDRQQLSLASLPWITTATATAGNGIDAFDAVSISKAFSSSSLSSSESSPDFTAQAADDDAVKNENKCYHFRSSDIASCYCMDALINALGSGGPATMLKELKSQPKGCTTFFINYSTGTALQYVTIFITVIVNKYLLVLIKYLVDCEYHTSVDKAQGSLVYKIFCSLYFNMAVLVLLASGRSGPQPQAIQQMHIMQGLYNDLDAKWFGNIGTYFILTFVTQVSTPILTSLVMYYVVGPLKRAFYFPGVRKLTTSISRQHDLNVLQVGDIFDATTNQAQVLANVFFAMTYAAGLPISMPLAMVACIFYFYMDKLLLLRYFQKPPKLGNSVMLKVLDMLYYAALIRLAIGCWMFGLLPVPWRGMAISFDDFYKDDDVSNVQDALAQTTASYTAMLNTIRSNIVDNSASSIVIYFTNRIFIPNVFPMFLLFICLIILFLLTALLRFIYRTVPIFWLLECILKSCSKKKVYDSNSVKMAAKGQGVDAYDIFMMKHELRKQAAPMTKPYFKFIPGRNQNGICGTCCSRNKVGPDPRESVSVNDREEGWNVIEENELFPVDPNNAITEHHLANYHLRYITVKHWLKPPPIISDILVRRPGDLKRTFEIVREHACSSYALDQIPAYQTITLGIIESLRTLQDDDLID